MAKPVKIRDVVNPITIVILMFYIGDSIIALCSYPLKLGGQKIVNVKAQFSLNFVPNFKISVLTGKELYKIWGIFVWIFLSKMFYPKP